MSAHVAQIGLEVLATVLAAGILAALAAMRRYVQRDLRGFIQSELVQPVQQIRAEVAEVRADLKAEKRKRKGFQRLILQRMESYESAAEVERQEQVKERQRVAAPPQRPGRRVSDSTIP